MTDTAQALYKWDGVPIEGWEDVQVNPQGGESHPRRTISPKNRSPGMSHGQKPSWDITANADYEKGPDRIDYDHYADTKETFKLEEEFDTYGYVYPDCVLQPFGHGTDTETKAAKRNLHIVAPYRYKVYY